MEQLLKKDFISFFNLQPSHIPNLTLNTNADLFQITEDNNHSLNFCSENEIGEAKFNNPNNKVVSIVAYEKFFRSLEQHFQYEKNICDCIIYSDNFHSIILAELTKQKKRLRTKYHKAIIQLTETLDLLMSIDSIKNYFGLFKNKHCCFFSRKPYSPPQIKAVNEFNRLNKLNYHGFIITDEKCLNKSGFKFYLYSGNQEYNFN